MSQNPDEGGEKSHEPTQKKLDDARKKGDLPKSVDLITAAAYAGFLLTLIAFGSDTMMAMGESMAMMIEQADLLSTQWFQDSGTKLSLGFMLDLSGPMLMWFGIPALCALAAVLAQRAFVVAPERIKPKLNKISLIANAKNKFGVGGLFEFAKSAVKLVIYSVILFLFLYSNLPEILQTVQFSEAGALIVMLDLCVEFFAVILVIAFAFGVIDLVFQNYNHIRKNMMSRKELTDEMKTSEGDPYIKQQRRQRAQEIAMNSMLAEVPKADVVIVNPEHYAVALKWSRLPGSAPVCVAKGIDTAAQRIKSVAREAGVPIHRDATTARALHASVELDQEIPPEHYRAVAAAIQFSEAMRAKARRRIW